MKNLVIVCLLFFAGIIGFSSCEKIEKDTPKAIKKLIRENKEKGGTVIEYEYNNENIYMWDYLGDFGSFDYYDKNANLLWRGDVLDGEGQGTPLEGYKKATRKRIVWTSKNN